MAGVTKILLRTALIGGGVYLVYRNWDKITGKINKLSRMQTMDEVVDDLGKTANNALEGLIDMADEAFEYVTTLGEGKEEMEMPNPRYMKEIEAQVEGLDLRYGTQLKSIADNLVVDIRRWNEEDNYGGEYTKKGQMPIQSFIRWHNYFSMKKPEDFKRVTTMMNIMLQYKHPYEIEYETVKDTNLPTVDYYINNPPVKFTQLNEIDWGTRKKFHYSLKPKDLFRVINDRLRNEGLISSHTRGQMIINPRGTRVVGGKRIKQR